MVAWPLPPEVVFWVAQLATPLHARHAWRLLPLLRGLLFAWGRRTVAAWLRAAGLGHDYKRYYYFLGALGRKAGFVASLLLRRVADVVAPGQRVLLGLDDTPTKRYGPRVEGAGVHRNPSPGPAAHKFLYGHVWVSIAWLAHHPLWGVIGLPLRALLYVRKKDIGPLALLYGIPFRTKLEMAAELVAWAADWLRYLGKVLWVVADGAYARRRFLKAARAAGVVVVSRLRKDAALWSVPVPPRPGARRRRGRPPTYGKQGISLAKRAGQCRGWQSEELVLYGQAMTKRYKTFLATYRPAGGPDPGGAGAGGGRLGGVLLHRPPSDGRRGVFGRGRPRGGGAGLSRHQGGSWGGAAAVAPLLGQRGGVPPDLVGAHAGGAVGLAAQGGAAV
jgi:hypothetical protein